MLFEQYKDYEYDRKKMELEIEYHTPKTIFVKAFGIELLFRDVWPYLIDDDRKLKLVILNFIVQYCKTMIPKWKINEKYYENFNHGNIEKPNEECSHTFYFFQYLDEWSLCIYSTQEKTLYSYVLSESTQKKIKTIFTEKGIKVDQRINIQQSVTIAEEDTIVMVKLLYQICKQQELIFEFTQEMAIEWRKMVKVIDLFLFELHKQYKEQMEIQQNQSKSQTHSNPNLSIKQDIKSLEFNPDKSKIGEAPSSNQSLKSIKQQASFEKSLSISREAHGQVTDEMIQLSKEEYNCLIDNFKQKVIQELQQIEPQHPTVFLQKYLKGNGDLMVKKDDQGKDELVVKLKGEQLQVLLQQYEKYYQQQINNKQFEKQQEQMKQQYQQYIQFQQLLNYYYQHDPPKYSKLVTEYYNRLNEQTLQKLKPLFPQNIQQQESSQNNISQQSLKVPYSPQIQSLSYSKSSDRYNKPINPLIQPNFNVSKSFSQNQQLQNSINLSKSIDPQFKPSPQNTVVCSRYNKQITYSEINLLQNKGEMTENLLNFYIRYLEEKQSSLQLGTLKQLKLRVFYLSTTFYKTLIKEYNNPDSISYQSASVYTSKHIGKDNTIFDKFDIILIPIVIASGLETILININLAQQTIYFYDSLINGVGSQSMAQSHIAQNGLLNNPFLMCCLRFLEIEYNQKLMKTLSLLKWNIVYSPHEKIIENSKTNTMIAFLMTQISKGIQVEKTFTIQLDLAKFTSNLLKLFSQLGITQNRKNELNFEKMVL
ncbi:unnamed protein product [Paramecium primaurelia]|uniref:Ubiquitin-like protease family profile domain-containing protein n=1 Tax=Paramecium primaurelia TaxID=5886 RepID=A0A8S1NWA7_PARPR|nr:unnamed protein product [Paramecium primaurelia]